MSTQRGASRSREPRKSVLNRHDDANHVWASRIPHRNEHIHRNIDLPMISSRGGRVIKGGLKARKFPCKRLTKIDKARVICIYNFLNNWDIKEPSSISGMFLGTDGAEEDLEIILRMFSSFLLFVYRFIVKYLYIYSFIFFKFAYYLILRNILNSDTSTKFDQHYQENPT